MLLQVCWLYTSTLILYTHTCTFFLGGFGKSPNSLVLLLPTLKWCKWHGISGACFFFWLSYLSSKCASFSECTGEHWIDSNLSLTTDVQQISNYMWWSIWLTPVLKPTIDACDLASAFIGLCVCDSVKLERYTGPSTLPVLSSLL